MLCACRYDTGAEGMDSRAGMPGFKLQLCHSLAGDLRQVVYGDSCTSVHSQSMGLIKIVTLQGCYDD